MAEDIFIPVNAKKLLFQTIFITILGIVGLVVGFGIAEGSDFLEPWIWQGVGIIICLFALIGAGAKMRRRSDKTSGIYLTKEGINDNTSEISLGLVKWNDIKTIDPEKCLKEDMLIVEVKQVSAYRKRAKNSAIGRLLDQNIRRYETPVVIDPSYLKGKSSEIIETVIGALKQRR